MPILLQNYTIESEYKIFTLKIAIYGTIKNVYLNKKINFASGLKNILAIWA